MAAAAALLAGSCGGSETAGRVQVSPSQMTLGFGVSRPLRLTFQPLAELDKVHGTPTVFVHLIHPVEKLVRTFDHPLPQPWVPGVEQSYEIDLYQSVLAEPLAAGSYRLSVGLYDDEFGYRWILEGGSEELGKREYVVGNLTVPEKSSHPEFTFSGGWRPPEPTGNRQILARRCLVGPAALDVRDAPGDGAVHLRLSVPAPPAGATTALRLGGDCLPEPQDLPAGPHSLQLPLSDPASSCQLLFQPTPAGPRPCLDLLTWHGAGA